MSIIGSLEFDVDFVPWSCNDITEDLCTHLQLQNGSVVINDHHSVQYWRFFSAMTDDDSYYSADGVGGATSKEEKAPLVIIPGGPAFWTHEYLIPLKQQACRGRSVYFYNPSSPTHQPDVLGYLSNIELAALVETWGLSSFSLVGHGLIGGMIALAYATSAATKLEDPDSLLKLESLVLLSTASDIQLYYESQWDPIDGHLGRLPQFVQERIHTLIREQAFDSMEYRALVQSMYPLWLTRTWPIVDCALATLQQQNLDHDSYDDDEYFNIDGARVFNSDEMDEGSNTIAAIKMVNQLLGRAHDFMLDLTEASLVDFNVTDTLSTFRKCPVLIISGEFDIVRPVVVDTLIRSFPIEVEQLVVPNAGHLTMIDAPKIVNDAIGNFLRRVDEGYTLQKPSKGTASNVLPWLGTAFAILVMMGAWNCIQRAKARRRREYELII